jgi:hypothetical protein
MMTGIREVLEQHVNTSEEIYSYFGYRKEWRRFLVSDCREYYWYFDDSRDPGDLYYTPIQFEETGIESGKRLYTDITVGKWNEGGLTMIEIERNYTHNKRVMIFDDDKELIDEALIEILKEKWITTM